MTLASASASLAGRLEDAWQRSDQLFALLKPEALYRRPIALRQPFIFYVGHLPAFAWNQVVRGLLARDAFRPQFDELFARGIDPVGVDHYQPDRPEQWPALGEVLAYRDQVRAALRASFDDVEARGGDDPLAEHGRVYSLVIEHELMHHETLLYMMQQLGSSLLLRPRDLPAYLTSGAAAPGVVRVPGGEVTLGARWDHVEFGWDNEFPAHDVVVGDCEMDVTAVRNGEWLEFIEHGGYRQESLWRPEDWAWRERVGHDHPVFWKRDGNAWHYLTMFDELPLADVSDWPVYVSWAEAQAFARWKRSALPTEAEFHRAAEGLAWGEDATGNLGFRHWAPVPSGRMGAPSRHGVRDLAGNGWEWTASRFLPYPGFTPWARTYPGYSADFFDDQHYVMLGASWATDPALVRRSFRNWFQPHYPYVFAKFRTVRRPA